MNRSLDLILISYSNVSYQSFAYSFLLSLSLISFHSVCYQCHKMKDLIVITVASCGSPIYEPHRNANAFSSNSQQYKWIIILEIIFAELKLINAKIFIISSFWNIPLQQVAKYSSKIKSMSNWKVLLTMNKWIGFTLL